MKVVFVLLVTVGSFGFLGTFFLPQLGGWLNGVELPTFFDTTTIALQNGERLTATLPTQRIQHYARNGRFVNGWFVDAKGGNFGVGMGGDGNIVVCTGRARQLLIFNLDGTPEGGPRHCPKSGDIPATLQPRDFPTGDVHLRPVISASRPSSSIVSFLLVPLWHPFVAWALAVVGVLGLRYARKAAPKEQ